MARTTSRHAAALAKARERRRALERERDARDARIEERAADALVVLEQRAVAQEELDAVTAELGGMVRDLVAEELSAEHVAALLDLDATDVRRLVKVTGDGRNPALRGRGSRSPGDPPSRPIATARAQATSDGPTSPVAGPSA